MTLAKMLRSRRSTTAKHPRSMKEFVEQLPLHDEWETPRSVSLSLERTGVDNSEKNKRRAGKQDPSRRADAF